MKDTAANPVTSVSDTAKWVAIYRANESDRADALFHDPFARRLGGAQGEAIARNTASTSTGWAIVVRTVVLDEIILDRIANHGCDMVVNLASGLDTRPWRLTLPPTLRWVEVDLPGISAYKAEQMRGETPTCQYEAVSVDLTDATARRALFARLGSEAANILVITEGLLIYLTASDVEGLAADLHTVATFKWWLSDLASPELIKRLNRGYGKLLAEGNAPFQFAPASSTQFFTPFGWNELSWRSTMSEAVRVERTPPGMWFWRILFRFASNKARARAHRFSGYMLLERL